MICTLTNLSCSLNLINFQFDYIDDTKISKACVFSDGCDHGTWHISMIAIKEEVAVTQLHMVESSPNLTFSRNPSLFIP